MKITTSVQMRKMDEMAINNFQIPSIVLMENAARCVCDVVLEKFDLDEKSKIAVFAGKGNNGGDAYAVARLLFNKGIKVDVIAVGDTKSLKSDALINYRIARNMGINIIKLDDFFIKKLHGYSLIIDGILGTGIKGEVKDDIKKVMDIINNYDKPVVSIDIPSGVEGDTGKVSTAIKADITVTFAAIKIGMIIYPGASYCGEIIIGDISMPIKVLNNMEINSNILTEGEARQLLPKRIDRSNKGTYGKLFVIAGSSNMSGAAALAINSGYRSGAGVVYACVPKSAMEPIKVLANEAVEIPLSDKNGFVCNKSFEEINTMLPRAKAIILGPGLGVEGETKSFIEKVIKSVNCPMIIDADGLNNICGNLEVLKETFADIIITPHPMEMSRLMGKDVSYITENLIDTATYFAREYKCVVLLKDARTVIASPDGRYFINTTGTNAMAKGGSGDVLSGIIGGLLSQGLNTFDATVLGAYVHGKAGEFAKNELGSYGVLAGDISRFIPFVLKNLE